MQQKYYVSHDGTDIGPFTAGEIVSKVKDRELELTDFVYDEGVQDWVLLVEFPILSSQLKELKPKKSPPKQKPSLSQSDERAPNVAGPENSNDQEWYVLKGENKFGPFTYLDLIRMLQEKVIFEFDFVWNGGMKNWKRVAEINGFAPDEIRNLKGEKKGKSSNIFFRRRHKRVRYGGSIIVHDNRNVWKGKGIEISEGGAGIVMDNALILPGQTLYLHFKPGDGVPPFNAICEVVSKKYVEGVQHRDAPIKYGVKFTSISNKATASLQGYAKQQKVGQAA